jgi:hypothetical protein
VPRWLLLVAVVALAAALFTRNWASPAPRIPDERNLNVGLWDYSFRSGDHKFALPLSELPDEGSGLGPCGVATLVAGLVAIAVMLAGAVLLRKPRSLGVRIALSLPMAASLAATSSFVAVLRSMAVWRLGWSPYVALGAPILAGVVLAWPVTSKASRTAA